MIGVIKAVKQFKIIAGIKSGGFGFITYKEEVTDDDDTVKDIFFHATGVEGRKFNELLMGDRVTFEIGDSLNTKTKIKSKIAKKVTIII